MTDKAATMTDSEPLSMTRALSDSPSPILLRVRTAARMVDRSVSALYEDINKGLIPVVRFGNSIRVPVAAIQKLVDEAMAQGGGK
jgi:hypothetical protein